MSAAGTAILNPEPRNPKDAPTGPPTTPMPTACG